MHVFTTNITTTTIPKSTKLKIVIALELKRVDI